MALRLELRPQRRIRAQLLAELEDEDYVLAYPHHPIAYLRGGLWLLLAGLWTIAVVVTNGPVAALFPVFLFVLRGGWLVLGVYEDWFVVTDCRIFRVQGILNQRAAAMSLSRIVDFTMEQPLLGQVLNYGHLVFENAAQDQGLRVVRHLRGVDDLNNLIQKRVFEAGGGPAKHKKAVKPVVIGSDAAGGSMTSSEGHDLSDGWGTYGDPWDDLDATGEIRPVNDED